MYLELPENIIPRLTEIIEHEHNYWENQLIYQDDGTLPYYALPVRQYIDQSLSNR